MAAIDVHAHYVPRALRHALGRRQDPPCLVYADGTELVDCGGGLTYPLLSGLGDLDGSRARATEEGIAHSLLSAPPPGMAGLPEAEARSVAAACNDELAAIAICSGGSCGGLALLPTEHPVVAVEELCRAAARGLAGAQLFSNAGGRPLDAPEFRPLFEEAARLDLPLVLHPASPVDRVAVADYGLLTTLGFVFDTTACACRLVLAGIFERHPSLKLVVPHVGATIPYLLGRFDYEFELMFGSSKPPSEQLRLLYLDSIAASPGALRLAVEEYGAERILFGSDEPFWSARRGRETLRAAQLGAEPERLILHGNAERLFGWCGTSE